MSISLKDRVKQTTNTKGTGTLSLVSTPTGFRSFDSCLSDGDTTYYCIESGSQWEVGVGTYSSNALARTTVLASSNSGSLIDITATRSFVFISYVADKATYKDGSGRIVSGAAGIVFSDNSVQTTAATTPDLSSYLTEATAASTYVALSGSYSNPDWITGLAWGKLSDIPSAVSSLSGVNSGDQDLSSYATIAAVAAGYLPLTGGTLTGALSLGSNALTCGAITASDNITLTSGKGILSSGAFSSQLRLVDGFGAGTGFLFSGYNTPSNYILNLYMESSGEWNFRLRNTAAISWTNSSIANNGTRDLVLLRGGPGILQQRNGLNAQCYELFETYTSSTNYGALRIKATSSGHQIGSARGTSGSNRAVQLGHFDASDVFTSKFNVGTDTAGVGLNRNAVANIPLVVQTNSVSSDGMYMYNNAGTMVSDFGVTGGGHLRWRFRNSSSTTVVTINTDGVSNGLMELVCPAAGSKGYVVKSSASQTAALFEGQSSSGVSLFSVTNLGGMILTPPSTATLATNGHFSVEMTSNTTGNLVYRGSDGTTRRMGMDFDTTPVEYLTANDVVDTTFRVIPEAIDKDLAVSVVVLSDSTGMVGASDNRWPIELLRNIRALYPTRSTVRLSWDATDGRLEWFPETIKDGSTAYFKATGNNVCPAGTITTVTGSQGLAAKLRSDDWATDSTTTNPIVVAIHGGADPNRAIHLGFNGERILRLQWYPTGSAASVLSESASTTIPDTDEPIWVAAELLVDNGSGGYEVRFYTKLDSDANWVQLGLTQIGIGTTTVPAVDSKLYVGRRSTSIGGFSGEVREGMWWTGNISDSSELLSAHWQADLSNKYGYVDAYGVLWTQPSSNMFNVTSGVLMVNHSISGASADDVGTSELGDIGADPQLVIISYSHNHGAERDINQIIALVDRVETRWPAASVVITLQNPKTDAHANVNEHSYRILLLSSYAKKRGFVIVDAFKAFLDYGDDWDVDLMDDTTHPNTDGYVIWGREAATQLLNYVDSTGLLGL